MSTQNIASETSELVLPTDEQVEHIVGNLTAEVIKRLPREQAQRIITNGGMYQRRWTRMVDELFAEEFEEYYLDLDPSVPFEQRVARGNYGYVNPNITPKNFRLTKSGRRKIVLYDPKGSVSSDEMIRRMTDNGDTPASLDDAVELGYKFPERQQKNPIVFLDESTRWVDPYRRVRVPVLDEWHGERELILRLFDDGWFGRCRFAAVRELPSIA